MLVIYNTDLCLSMKYIADMCLSNIELIIMARTAHCGCIFQSTSCYVDDVCYQYGDPNPDDSSQICLPDVDPAGWTTYTSNNRKNLVI